MTFCRECGSELAPNEHFCGECGTKASAEASPPPTEPVPTVLPPPEPSPPVPPPSAGKPTTSKTQRTAMYVGGAVVALVLVAVVLLLTRGDEENAPVGSEPAASTTLGAVGSETTAAEATTTLPPSTTEPATTVAPSTEPPTTPPPASPTVAAGWRPAQMIPEAKIPPPDGSWTGAPSPVIDGTAQIPDGVYWVDYVAQDGATLTLTLGRFESCSILNDEFMCGPGPYGSDAIGRVNPGEREVSVALDDTVRVVIEGWDCSSVTLEGNGADLGNMYAALGADYTRAFTDGLNAGGDPNDLMLAARNDPSTGFTASSAECDDGYQLVWRSGGAPPVLVQGAVDFETGGAMDPAMLIDPTAIEIVGGQTTVYFYAGFYS